MIAFFQHHLARSILFVSVFVITLGLSTLRASQVDAAPRASVRTCDEAGLDAALAAGGPNTFSCASATTIIVSATKTVTKNITLDGGRLLTISGGGLRQVFIVNGGETATFQNLTIADGKDAPDSYGGGIANNGGTVTVTNSTLTNNSAGVGGGICNNGGTVTVTNSTFANNYSNAYHDWGGGIYNYSGTLTIANSTFANNYAYFGGSGIFNEGGALTITNSTFANNSGLFGGGILNYSGALTVTNSTFANNRGGDCLNSGMIGTEKNNLIRDTGANACGLTNGIHGDIIGLDPKLGALANNGGPTQTMALLHGSPAIDKGDNATCAASLVNGVDQRGYPRFPAGDPICDIGAYEVQPAAPTSPAEVPEADMLLLVGGGLGGLVTWVGWQRKKWKLRAK